VLAAAKITPYLSVIVLGSATVAVVWYWKCLGAARVPVSRRWIRRASTGLMLVAFALVVRALSFLDPQIEAHKLDYAHTWIAVLLLVGLIGISAVADLVNTVRLVMRQQASEVDGAANDVLQELEEARRKNEL
jgi:hypothetical protein